MGGSQVLLPGHGDEIENPNWASMVTGHKIENDVVIQPLEGGQVGQQGLGMSHRDAALRATGVRHIYLFGNCQLGGGCKRLLLKVVADVVDNAIVEVVSLDLLLGTPYNAYIHFSSSLVNN